jgi:hypothetical protein
MTEKVLHEVRIIETDDGFRIEIKGDKEEIKKMGFGRFGRRGAGPGGFFGRWHGGRGFWGRGRGYGPPPWGWDWEESDEADDAEKS